MLTRQIQLRLRHCVEFAQIGDNILGVFRRALGHEREIQQQARQLERSAGCLSQFDQGPGLLLYRLDHRFDSLQMERVGCHVVTPFRLPA